MRRTITAFGLAGFVLAALSFMAAAPEANGTASAKEVYTGTIINVSGWPSSVGFNLTIDGQTSNEEAQRYLSILAGEGQDGLMKAVHNNRLGYIAATGQTRRDLLVVRETQLDGRRRNIAAFERWLGFFERSAGNRSVDYPFSIIDITFDQNRSGSGTFIGLAQVRMARNKNTEQVRLEVENFAGFPAKVIGVTRRGD